MDNALALVSQHDPEREVLMFAQRLEEFARYWGFKPRACRPGWSVEVKSAAYIQIWQQNRASRITFKIEKRTSPSISSRCSLNKIAVL